MTGCVPRQSRYNFLGDMEKANFFRRSAECGHSYDNCEWSRTRRKCQIQREYGLYLHPPVVGGLGCIFQPLAEQNSRADLQIDGRVPVSTMSTLTQHPQSPPSPG
jgi:hypothetical protein